MTKTNRTDRRELQPDGWTKLPWTILLNPDLTPTEKVVLALLLSRDGAKGIFPSIDAVAAELGASRNTADRTLRALRDRGIITARKLPRSRGGSYHRYSINWHNLPGPHPQIGESRIPKLGTELDTGELDTESLLHDHSSSDPESYTTANKFAAADLDADAPQTTPPTVHNVTDDPHEPSVAVAGAPEPGTTGAGNPGPFTVTQRMQLIRDIAAIAECEYQMSLTKDSDSATVADAGVRLAEATDYFAAHLIDMIGEDDYNDFYADYIDNGKWTFHPRCVDHYEAGKELNKLIHSVNKIYA